MLGGKVRAMTFLAFKTPLFLPGLLQFGEDEPRPPKAGRFWAHTPGGADAAPFPEDPSPSPDDKYDERGCRRPGTISPGEVQSAFALYENQLMPTDDGALVRRSGFYTIPLLRYSGAPAFLFGRVKVCMPTDGHIQDMQEVELSFPQAGGAPERIVLEPHDVNLEEQVQSYRVRVKIFGAEADRADFMPYQRKFAEAGFDFDFGGDYNDLLQTDLLERESLPWFHVIGSRWFARIPASRREGVKRMLLRLCSRETLILNYHPRHARGVLPLNEQLEFQPRLSEFLLSDPWSPEQVHFAVRTVFEKIFAQPGGRSSQLTNRQQTFDA